MPSWGGGKATPGVSGGEAMPEVTGGSADPGTASRTGATTTEAPADDPAAALCQVPGRNA